MRIENMVGLRYPQFLIWLISSDSSYPWSIKKRMVHLFFAFMLVNLVVMQKTAMASPLIVDARDFGVSCDDVTDNKTALQNAINSMTAGGILQLPVGICKTTSGISIPYAIKLLGQGQGKTFIKTTDTTGNVITLSSYNIEIADITFTSESPRIADSVIYGSGTGHIYLHNIDFQYYYRAISFYNTIYTVISNIFALFQTDAAYSAVLLFDGNNNITNDVLVTNVMSENAATLSTSTAYGIWIRSGNAITFTDLFIQKAK